MARELIHFADTKFIFRTNFAGDPSKDKYKSDKRKGNLVLNDIQAHELMDKGFNVKVTKPRSEDDNDFEPVYYITINVKFGDVPDYWPKIYLISGNNPPVRLLEDNVGRIDDLWVKKVECACAEYISEKGKTLWVRSMYVTQNIDEDPFAEKYFGSNNGIHISDPAPDDDLPF